MRIFTLVSFFFFSGLNNGFTYFMVNPGTVQRVDFAPALVMNLVRGFNPVAWKNAIFRTFQFSLYKKSSRVIESASRGAVQNLLIETTLLQIWVVDSCLKAAGRQNQAENLATGNITSPQTSASLPAQSVGLQNKSEKNGALQITSEYMKSDRRESWLVEKLHLWKAAKFRAGIISFLSPGGNLNPAGGNHSPPRPKIQRKFVTFLWNILPFRRVFGGNSKEDDLAENFILESMPSITPALVAGVIFFIRVLC